MPPPLFLRPSRPSLPRVHPPGVAHPLILLISFLTAPVPPLGPSLLRHPHYYSLSGAPLLSLLTERFHRRRFFLGTRRRLPFVLVYRILSSTDAPYEARVALRSPRERINECFTLSPAGRPVCFRARARICFAIIHYVFCTFCVPRSFSLFLRFYQRASFSPTISLPCVPSNRTSMRSPRFCRNFESRLTSRTFSFFFIILFFPFFFYSLLWISL